RPDRLRRHVLRLPGRPVKARHLAAEDDVGVERIGGDVAVLLDADGLPVAAGDLPERAAAEDRRRTALLLAAVDPVGERVVGDDVVDLRGRLVVPRPPGLAAVNRHNRPLVAGQEDDLRIVRADPDGVVVVATGGTFKGREGLATVGGTVGRGI